MESERADETGEAKGFWSLVTLEGSQEPIASAATPVMLQRFADLLSPALARELLHPASVRLQRELIDPDAAEKISFTIAFFGMLSFVGCGRWGRRDSTSFT